jgi:lycopene cyclase domain-containing protein
MSFWLLLMLLLPPLVVLLILLRRGWTVTRLLLLFTLCILAVGFAVPIENFLAARGVWYYQPDRISGMFIGFLPVESYIWFVLHPLLVGLFVLWVWQRLYPQDFGGGE